MCLNDHRLPANRSATAGRGPLRVGLLSTASVTRHIVAAAASSRNEIAITAVASRGLSQAEAFARRHAIGTAFGSYDELIQWDGVDVVYIPLPNALHVQWVVRCLEAKKHVLCEKPLSLTAAGVAEILAAREKNERECGHCLIVAEAVMSLYTTQTKFVKELIWEKKLVGDVVCMGGAFHYIRTRDSFRSSAVSSGGGSLWDVGCYPIYLGLSLMQGAGRRLTQQDASATAIWADGNGGRFDNVLCGTLVYTLGSEGSGNRPVALSTVSSFTASTNSSFVVHGTRGTLTIPNPFKPTATEVVKIATLASDGTHKVVELAVPTSGCGEDVNAYRDELLGLKSLYELAGDLCNHKGERLTLQEQQAIFRKAEITPPEFSRMAVEALTALHSAASQQHNASL